MKQLAEDALSRSFHWRHNEIRIPEQKDLKKTGDGRRGSAGGGGSQLSQRCGFVILVRNAV